MQISMIPNLTEIINNESCQVRINTKEILSTFIYREKHFLIVRKKDLVSRTAILVWLDSRLNSINIRDDYYVVIAEES